MIRGIDVSEHQGKIQWSRVKAAGIGFAVIRAGYGRELSQKDAQFEANYAGCTSAGIPAGAYWYSYAVTPEEARQEAAVCLRVLRGKSFAFPVYFDLEERRTLVLGRAACTAIAQAFLETVEQAGYFVGIYSSKSHLENYLTEELRKRYAVPIALGRQFDLKAYTEKSAEICCTSGNLERRELFPPQLRAFIRQQEIPYVLCDMDASGIWIAEEEPFGVSVYLNQRISKKNLLCAHAFEDTCTGSCLKEEGGGLYLYSHFPLTRDVRSSLLEKRCAFILQMPLL